MCAMHLSSFEAKLLNLMLKTWLNQFLGYLLLDILFRIAPQRSNFTYLGYLG
jgi:hypothetical protein